MHNLHKLLADNRQRAQFRALPGADDATIYLYDVIVSDKMTAEWCGGIDPQSFVKELNALTAPVIHLRINCPGGDVFAARAMEQAIREHPSQIIAHIDGYAASAASYMALAADEVHIAEGGFFMIHKAWTMAFGNADDLIDMAALLEKIDESLVATYARATKQPIEQIRTWMAAETWFNAEESVEFGFAHEVSIAAPKAKAAWDLSAYAHAPKAKAIADESTVADAPAPEQKTATHITDHLKRRLELVARTA